MPCINMDFSKIDGLLDLNGLFSNTRITSMLHGKEQRRLDMMLPLLHGSLTKQLDFLKKLQGLEFIPDVQNQ